MSNPNIEQPILTKTHVCSAKMDCQKFQCQKVISVMFSNTFDLFEHFRIQLSFPLHAAIWASKRFPKITKNSYSGRGYLDEHILLASTQIQRLNFILKFPKVPTF